MARSKETRKNKRNNRAALTKEGKEPKSSAFPSLQVSTMTKSVTSTTETSTSAPSSKRVTVKRETKTKHTIRPSAPKMEKKTKHTAHPSEGVWIKKTEQTEHTQGVWVGKTEAAVNETQVKSENEVKKERETKTEVLNNNKHDNDDYDTTLQDQYIDLIQLYDSDNETEHEFEVDNWVKIIHPLSDFDGTIGKITKIESSRRAMVHGIQGVGKDYKFEVSFKYLVIL